MNKTVDISFNDSISTPKYRQIIESIETKIKDGKLKKGDRIPSLNMICKQYNLSQDTVLMAYNELKSKGIISSQVGKGYFIQSEQVNINHRVLLLFDKLITYKEELYESFKATLKDKGSEQIFFHHNNPKLFQTILESSLGEFSQYVIMPIPDKAAQDAITKLPANKVYILDQGRKTYKNKYPSVYQDFERDIYRIFKQHTEEVNKYKRMILVIRHTKYHFKEIATGFRDFCRQHPIDFKIINDTSAFKIKEKDAFVVVDDRDLEYLVRYSMNQKFTLGKQIGIVSYNETSLKGIIANGITTISTDFSSMGKSMAEMIINNKKQSIDNPFLMNKRESF